MPTTAPQVAWITLAAMAARLRVPWARAWRFALEGQVRAKQRENGRWFVIESDVEKLAAAEKLTGRKSR